MTHTVRTATRADLQAISETHGAAFEDDPVARWLVGESRSTSARIGRLYRAVADGHLPDGLSLMTQSAESVAIWAAPGHYKVPLRRLLPHATGAFGALGVGGVGRLISIAKVEKLHPHEPHYYLASLGTRPADEGKGFASAALTPVLEQADSEGTGCFLESSKEHNVAFYARHGFEVTGTHDLAGGRGPRLWLMWREARPVTP